MQIRAMTPADQADVIAIADALPEWFNDDGRRNIRIDIRFQDGFVACNPGIAGFLLYYVNEAVGHIGWMGVAKPFHRQGIGKALVQYTESLLRAEGVRSIQVHTLGDGVEYEPYVGTRAFYRSMGYTTLRIETNPGNPGCPESLFLSKRLTA